MRFVNVRVPVRRRARVDGRDVVRIGFRLDKERVERHAFSGNVGHVHAPLHDVRVQLLETRAVHFCILEMENFYLKGRVAGVS